VTTPEPVRPRKLPFALQQGETVLLLARRHWVFLLSHLGRQAAFALVPIAALLVVVSLTAGLDGNAGRIVALICLVWFLAWAVKAYFTWYRYQNDIWVVTDQRVLDSTKRHWFHHGMASADLDDVEDIALDKEGLLPTMFDFGNVKLQTAAETPNFVLSGIPDPKDVLSLIDRQRDAAKRRLRGVSS
jgi:hypothetical protein